MVAEFREIRFKGLEILTKKSVRDQSFGSETQIQMGLLEFILDFFINLDLTFLETFLTNANK